MVVGYVTFHYPDPLERWSEGGLENLIELGAIEIAPDYRRIGAGKKILALSTQDPFISLYHHSKIVVVLHVL